MAAKKTRKQWQKEWSDKNVVVSCAFRRDFYQALKSDAHRHERSLSTHIRDLVQKGLKAA